MGNSVIRLRCLPARRERQDASKGNAGRKSAPVITNDARRESSKTSTGRGSDAGGNSAPNAAQPCLRVMEFMRTGFEATSPTNWDDKVLASLLGGRPTKLEDTHAVESTDGLLERGPVLMSDGSVYCGQWQDKVRHGFGKHYSMDGTRYVGSFVNDYYEGTGEILYMNGDNFKGLFKKGLRNGKGIMVYSNGDMFEGDWKDGVREGFGVERFADGSVYMGMFKNNKRDGSGELKLSNGVVYEGTFDNDVTGKGKMTWPNGESYIGELKNGYKH
ncbi:MORN repeat domain containing protein, partial [Babesia divergens]